MPLMRCALLTKRTGCFQGFPNAFVPRKSAAPGHACSMTLIATQNYTKHVQAHMRCAGPVPCAGLPNQGAGGRADVPEALLPGVLGARPRPQELHAHLHLPGRQGMHICFKRVKNICVGAHMHQDARFKLNCMYLGRNAVVHALSQMPLRG